MAAIGQDGTRESAIQPLKDNVNWKSQVALLKELNQDLRDELDNRTIDNVKLQMLQKRNKELEDHFKNERNDLQNVLVLNNSDILKKLTENSEAIVNLTTQFNDMADQINDSASSTKFDDLAANLREGIRDNINYLVQSLDPPADYSKEFKDVNKDVKAIGDAIDGLRESIDNNSERVGGLATQVKENITANAAAIKSLNEENLKIEAGRNTVLTNWTNEIKKAVKARDSAITEAVRAIADKKDHQLDLGPVQDYFKAISDSVDEIKESVENSGKTAAESSENVKSLADELRQESIEQKSQQGEYRTAEEAAALLEKMGKEWEKLQKKSEKREAAIIERIEEELSKTKTNAATNEIERLEKKIEAKAIGEVKKEIEATRDHLEKEIKANNPEKAIKEVRKEIKVQLDSVLKKIDGAINDGGKFGDIERAIKTEFGSLQTKIKEPDLAKAIEAALRKVLKEKPELANEVQKSLDVLRGFIN